MYINMYIMSIHATNLLKSILELMMIKILCLTTFLASSQQVQHLLEMSRPKNIYGDFPSLV